jgi:hypothetical protein
MGLLDQYLPNWLPDDPNKNAAARQGLLALGATMLNARGNLGESLGQGLLAGAGGYNGALAQQGQQQLRDAQLKQTGLENQKLQSAMDEPAQLAAILAGKGPISAGVPGGVKPVSALPQIGAAPAPSFNAGAAAAPAPQEQASAPQQAPAAQSQYETYMMYGDRLTQAGKPAAAKQYYDIAEKMKPKIKEQRVLTIDGRRVMANVFEDGTTKIVDGFSPDQEKLSFQNTGGATVALDPFTGKPVNTIKNSVSPDASLSAETARRGQNMTAATAAAGDQAPISTGAIDNAAARYNFDGTLPPMGMGKNAAAGRSAILNRAAEMKSGVDPEQQRRDQLGNKNEVATQGAAGRSFATGKDGQGVQAANTALNHLETIRTLAAAQKSGDMRVFNQAARALGAQFGSAAPTNLNAALIMVAPEVSKAVIGAGGTGHERDEAIKALNPNGSPDQIIGATHTMQELFGGRLTEARRTYERTTKKKDFDEVMLSPAARKVIGAATTPVKDVKDLPKVTGQYSDAEKEARYQAWKRSQGK